MNDEYDTIVVGAGAAGAPLAARLSDDPDRRVLLLEAGPDYPGGIGFPEGLEDYGNMQGSAPGHPNNWSFVGELTPELPYSIARGKIVGGSTALNGTYWVRGREEDFERFVELGNEEWSFEKVLPYYREMEADPYGEERVHGRTGPLPVHRPKRRLHELTLAFAEACRELGFADDPDKNDQGTLGVGPVPMNVEEGTRINSSFAFLDPIRSRSNLTVQGDSFVRRVLVEGGRAVGVEVERGGRIETVAGREVVLSAGAVKSPHILLVSGIGPRAQLESVGVEVSVDSPGVGQNFSDHPDIGVNYKLRRGVRWRADGDGIQYMLNCSAGDTSFGGGDIEIVHTIKPFGVWFLGSTVTDPKNAIALMKRPLATLRGIRGISLSRLAQQMLRRHDFALLVALQQPVGRGRISLTSADPEVQPRIEYRYFEEEEDRRRMREAIRTAVAILESSAYRGYVVRLTELTPALLGDDRALDRWMRKHLASAIHASGSCRMGPDSDPEAVVDQYGRVRGVDGLRVADTSILPTVLSRGPACSASMVGIRIADFIRTGR